jgi:capsular polysaccharide biosynthesis protein
MIPEEIKNTEENILRYRERINNFSKEFELGLFIYLLSKVKWIIVLVFLMSLSVSLIYLRYTPNNYKTSTTIQLNIKKQNDDFLDIYSYQQQTNLNSEVELLKSQIIIDKLIKTLKLDKIYYSEGEILTRNLYKSSPFEIKNTVIKDSSIIGKFLYLRIKDKYLSLTNEDESITYAEYIQPNNYFSSRYFSGELNIKQSFDELNKTLEDSKYFLVFPSVKNLRSEIRAGLEISILDYSANTINISYEHSNPKFAQDVCNSIAKEYLNYDLEKKAVSSVNIVEFITAQKDSVEIRLKRSEREIQGFKKLNNVNSSSILKTSNISQLDEIDKKILEIKLEISMMERFTNKFNQTLSTEINSSSINNISLTQIFYNDEFILNMVKVLKEDLGKRDGLLRDITVNNENIILINNKIEQQGGLTYVKTAPN